MNETDSVFDILKQMKRDGIPEDIVARRIGSFLQNKARETNTPYHGVFELTPLCNLDCKMCYVHLHDEQLEGRKLLTAKEWTVLMQQAIDAGMIKATISGGECLTYPWFDEVFLFLKSKGITTSVLTNAVLMDDKRICFFQRHRPRKIQISLYGSSDRAYEEVTGKRVFSTVINNIIAAKEAGLPVKISITPSKYMLADIKNIIKLAKDLDVPYAINIGLMTPRVDTGRDKIEHDITIDDYVEIIKYNRALNNHNTQQVEADYKLEASGADYVNSGIKCGAGRSTFTINWKGIMNPCSQMSTIAADPINSGVLGAWKSINEEVKTYPRFKKCDRCAYSHACDFCAAENEKLGSRYVLDQRWCERTRKMIESGLRLPEIDCK